MPDVTPRVRSYRCSVAGRTVSVSSTCTTLRDPRPLLTERPIPLGTPENPSLTRQRDVDLGVAASDSGVARE